MISTLRLFNGIIIPNKEVPEDTNSVIWPHEKSYEQLTKETLKKGYIVDKAIYFNLTPEGLKDFNKAMKEKLTFHRDWNNSFYKSWNKLETLSDFELRLDQLFHYFTTYGAEALGIKDSFVYLPKGNTFMPPVSEDFSFLYIRGFEREEIQEKIVAMVGSGIALKEETIEDLLTIVMEFSKKHIFDIFSVCKNKEVKVRLAELYDFIPKNVGEFLRYVIYKNTGKSLVIKNKATIDAIKIGRDRKTPSYFYAYRDAYGLESLAKNFYRYKPLLLAFRSAFPELKPLINQVRKLAVKFHEPMKEDFLNTVTKKIKQNAVLNLTTLEQELFKANTFRKVRLLYALQNLESQTEDKIYNIRNGKQYVTKASMPRFKKEDVAFLADKVYSHIVEDIKPNVEGKTVLVHPRLAYALPSSEKNFIGNYPVKSKVEFNSTRDLIIGVHWKNQKNRVDLDLSLLSLDGTKFGWNGRYRDEGILFSGDVTDAPGAGASEFYYFKGVKDGMYSVVLNYYNSYGVEEECPFDIIIGAFDGQDINRNFMLRPENIVFQASSSIGPEQINLGMVVIEGDKKVFSMIEGKRARASVSANDELNAVYLNALKSETENIIFLTDVLTDAGAVVVEDREDSVIDFDLTPTYIQKDTIMSMFTKER